MTRLAGQLFTGAGALAAVFAMCAAGVSPQSTVLVIFFFALPGLVLFLVGLWLIRKARAIEYERYVEREMQYQQQLEPFRGDVTPARGMPAAMPPPPQQQYQYPPAQHYQPAPQIVYVQQPLSRRDRRRIADAKRDEFAKGCASFIVLGIIAFLVIGGDNALKAVGDIIKSVGISLPSGNRPAASGVETDATRIARMYDEDLRVKFERTAGVKSVSYATYDGKEVSAEVCVFPGEATEATARSLYLTAAGHFVSGRLNMWIILHDGSRSVNYRFDTRNDRWVETILTTAGC